MTTQLNIVGWSKTLSLDRHLSSPVFHGFVDLPPDSKALSSFSPSTLHSEEISQYEKDVETPVYKSSFLYSAHLKRNLEESRKAFLNFSIESKGEEEHEHPEIIKENVEQKKTPSRKISFKCKKPTSYRRAPAANAKITTTLNPSTVAELTSKFNEMVAERNSILVQPKFARLVRRVNSQRSAQEDGANKRVARKPSVKLKPKPKIEENNSTSEQKKRPSIKQRTIIKNVQKMPKSETHNNSDKMCVRTKISYLEIPQIVKRTDVCEVDDRPKSTSPVITRTPLNSGSVRATIEIFERRSSQSSPDGEQKNILKETEKVPKPKVPEKNPNIKIKDLVVKNGVRKLKVFENRDSSDSVNANVDNTNTRTTAENVPRIIDTATANLDNVRTPNLDDAPITGENLVVAQNTDLDNTKTSTENVVQMTNEETHNIPLCNQEPNEQNESIQTKTDIEDEVQILNIPLVMPRRCDSMYETLNLRKVSPPAHLLKMAKSEGAVSTTNTIPTLPEPVKPNASFLWRRKSQEPHTNLSHAENENSDDWKSLYDKVEAKPATAASSPKNSEPPAVPPRPTSLNLSFNKPLTPPKAIFKKKMPLPEELEEKIYEELGDPQTDISDTISHSYEYCRSLSKYEDLEQKSDDGYEYFESTSPVKQEKPEDIYETLPLPHRSLPPLLPRRQEEPLPPRPPSRESYCTIQNGEGVSNCYESIYNVGERNANVAVEDLETISNNYESIYGCQIRTENWDLGSNRDSLVSSDQQSNSLYSRSLSNWPNDDVNVYNGKASSDLSGSDKSDEWIDISDNEENSKGVSGFVIVRERQRNRKTSGWSQKIRDQWNKSHSGHQGNSDSDHHYESLYNTREYQDNEDFDSFESDTESENSFTKINQNDSGVDMGNSQLPDPPTSQSYGFTRLAVSAGKHMRRLRRNWSLTKNDITKSLSRMAKRKSRTDLDTIDTTKAKEEETNPTTSTTKTQNPRPVSSPIALYQSSALSNVTQELKMRQADSQAHSVPYQNVQISNKENAEPPENFEKIRTNSLSKKKFLNKFRRSMSSISTEPPPSEVAQTLGNKPKSTFYLTDTIDVEDNKNLQKSDEGNSSASPIVLRNSKVISQRPQSPPPPIPVDANQNIDSPKLTKPNKRSTSWYAECGLFRNSENMAVQNSSKRPNTSWYAEIGLYQTSSASTPSTSSAENSGSTTNVNTKSPEPDSLTDIKNSEDYYNLKNENDYYNQSINSFNSDATMEKSSNISADIQLRLQDEPLYQFYDAAVLESVCQDGTTDFDYDGYEEVGDKTSSEYSETQLTTRPSAMQLISPSKNGITVIRTLWCEIPEVLQSAVLSTLSIHQKKLQEAKFEMMTSEASYLNSLNVLTDHFISHLTNSDLLTHEEKTILFSKIPAVKRCSEKLLADLEKCWQDNILLHGICDMIQKHAEENFYVYVSYCENQILLASTLRKLRERSSCSELLKQLECCSACQSLSLYSFLMLPMQRVTRWPLLVDAVLKRLSPQDDEYLPCQYTLATINKIVTQCNEAARKMERETEIKRIAAQIEFPKGIPSIKLTSGSRWLVRSGPLTQMQARADDIKLTFGKRFIKVPLHLFLFNDLLLVTKPRSDDCFVVLHYCSRSYIELNVNDVIGSLPVKDTQGRNLLFLTILENHEGKTVEMLLSCNSESDKERWIEALSAPKSEDPNETLYECWDCPQVTAIHPYGASQPDELALSRGDIVNVTRKMADGWYHGERIRDGQTGWFPANYTVEVANPHVRARNLKQRYRLLAFSENYLKSK